MDKNVPLPSSIKDYVDAPMDFFDLLDEVIPTEVCHYTNEETAIKYILKNKEIRLGRLGLTNDPRESKRWTVPSVGWGDELSKKGEDEILKNALMIEQEVNRILKEEWRVLCTVCHNYPYAISYPAKKEYDHHEYGFSHSRMWAQYAENHSGICLLFDGKILDENIHKYFESAKLSYPIFHGFVRYHYEASVRITPTYLDIEFQNEELVERIRKTLQKHYGPNFLYKSPEWKTEHEFRWLVRDADSADVLIPIQDALKAVIVGVGLPDTCEASLKELCMDLNVPAGRIRWDNGRPYVTRYSIYQP